MHALAAVAAQLGGPVGALAQIETPSALEKFVNSVLVLGLAGGAVYALIALGYVIIYKSSGVINFGQGGFMTVGAFLIYWLAFEVIFDLFDAAAASTWGFWLACLGALVLTTLLAMLAEWAIIRRMIGQPLFSVVIITLGIEVFLRGGLQTWFTTSTKAFLNPPFQKPIVLGIFGETIRMRQSQVFACVLAAVALTAFFLFFRKSRLGVAMRAVAFDQESAQAMGISLGRVFSVSWAMAGALAAVAAIATSLGGQVLQVSTFGFVALRAFPAAIVGGLDSPGGAVIGGLIIGVAEQAAGVYLPLSNFTQVAAYILMIIVLFVRPYGLFGTPEVIRV